MAGRAARMDAVASETRDVCLLECQEEADDPHTCEILCFLDYERKLQQTYEALAEKLRESSATQAGLERELAEQRLEAALAREAEARCRHAAYASFVSKLASGKGSEAAAKAAREEAAKCTSDLPNES